MSKKRPIAKRYDLNEYEENLLQIKCRQSGLSQAALIRELITGYAPTEAPGKEFYECMNKINKIGININQIAAVANSTGVIDEKWLLEQVEELNAKMLELKEIVLSAKPYHATYYEKLIYEQKQARKEGKPVPSFGDDLIE